MRVFLHTRKHGEKMDWLNTPEEFEQIPRVGEYIARTWDSPWFRVDLVVWLPESAKTEYQVEVYAVEVDQVKAQTGAHRRADAEIESGRH